MAKIKLEISGEFETLEKLEKYLEAVLNCVKISNKHKIPFYHFAGDDGEAKNKIKATAKEI